MTLTIGTQLGPYEIVAPLGAGGMGEVYRARDPRLGREVAIKVLPEDLADEPDRLQRFETEAKAAGALNHPNVLAIHDIGRHEGRPYVVYELLEGETLGERMRSGRLSQAEAVDCAVQTARGLAAAHAKGIVHRDLKPENLFLTKDGPLKILDFGLAKLVLPERDEGVAFDQVNESRLPESLTAAGTILGTAGYMSPEQVRGERADHRSDIFSLGVVLHEMLSGETPFKGETVPEMLTAILKEDPPELSAPDVSPALAEITGRCLSKPPEARFQSAQDLSFALGAVSGVERVASSGSGMETMPGAGGGGRRLLLLGGGLALVAGLAAVLWTALAPSGPPRMIGPRQVTTDGVGKYGLATDGKWLYYSTFEGRVFQMSVTGGQASEIDPWPDEKMWTFVRDINPADSTELMVISRPGPPPTNPLEELPLWVLSLPAATPRRLGEAAASSAAWSPSGDEIAFSKGTDIFVVGRDGESPRKILTAAGAPGVRDWSRGDRILHTVYNFEGRGIAPWEMQPDGTGRGRLLPDWPDPYFWDAHPTPDGRYLLFISGEESGGRFWALEEGSGTPVALGTDPLQCYFFTLDPKGLAAYATCMKRRSELFVYRPEVGEWAPYDFPPESSAWWLVDSPDGEWVAWAKYPEGTLWRSRRDGSQKLQLTEPGNLYATFPSWSPDGEWIAFGMGTLQGVVQRTFVVSRDGQGLRQIADDGTRKNRAAWAPDGRVILSFWDEEDLPLRLVDLETGESEEMPGTSHLYGVASSPDGRSLVATNRGHQGPEQIHLLDWETGEWRALEGAVGGLPQWSADSRSLYYTRDVGGDLSRWQVHRRRLDDGHTETVAEPAGLRPSGHTIWWRVDQDGRIVAQRSLEIWDVYAWDLELP